MTDSDAASTLRPLHNPFTLISHNARPREEENSHQPFATTNRRKAKPEAWGVRLLRRWKREPCWAQCQLSKASTWSPNVPLLRNHKPRPLVKRAANSANYADFTEHEIAVSSGHVPIFFYLYVSTSPISYCVHRLSLLDIWLQLPALWI